MSRKQRSVWWSSYSCALFASCLFGSSSCTVICLSRSCSHLGPVLPLSRRDILLVILPVLPVIFYIKPLHHPPHSINHPPHSINHALYIFAGGKQYLDPIIQATHTTDGAMIDICKSLGSCLREPKNIVSPGFCLSPLLPPLSYPI
jgi:hypothetical protein